MKNQSEKTLWRLLCFILCAMLFFGASVKVQAAPQKKLTLAQAVSLGSENAEQNRLKGSEI